MSNDDIDLSAAKHHIHDLILAVLKLDHITTQDQIKTYMNNSDLNTWIAAWKAEGCLRFAVRTGTMAKAVLIYTHR